MKSFCGIFLLFSLLIASAGCATYDDVGEVATTNDSINDMVIRNALTPLNRVVELADFYNRYRDIRDNETAVDLLRNSYFGETVSLQEYGTDGVEIDYWGRIDVTEEEGTWLAVLSTHWTGFDVSYTVTPTDSRSYIIEYNAADNAELTSDSGYVITLEADAEVTGDEVTIGDMDLVYTENSLREPLEVRVIAGSGDEALKVSLCREGEFTLYPVDGVLYYIASGYMSANFRVIFHGDWFEVLENEIAEPASSR